METEHVQVAVRPEPVVLQETTPTRPVGASDRIVAIDVLRGFALLGILVMNVQAFSMIDAAYMNPTVYGDLSGANGWVWYIGHLLADQKMMTLFSMLFGAGVVIMTSRAEASIGGAASLHYRRMGVLLVFGLLHGYLLWYGDILYFYALSGMIVYLFRNRRPVTLIMVGLAGLIVPVLLMNLFGWSTQFWGEKELIEFTQEAWLPTDEMIANQLAAYRGGWLTEIRHRAPIVFGMQTFFFLIFGWRIIGLMLIGMAMLKLDVLTARRSRTFYATLFVLGAGIALPLVAYGVHRNREAAWNVEYSFFYGGQYNYWGSILMSFGWMGLIMLVFKNDSLRGLTRPFAAVGQMALTNYFMQTLICTTIFYGRGLGLYGSVERVGQISIVFAIWTLQLIISPIWLSYFRFGPAEWLWRTLTYGKSQPMLRDDKPPPPADVMG